MPPVPAVNRALSVLGLLVHEREPLMLSDIDVTALGRASSAPTARSSPASG